MARRNAVLSSGLAHSVPAPARLACPAEAGARAGSVELAGTGIGSREVLLDVARSHPAVLRDPRPEVQLREFGESTLDFELLVWTRDPRHQSRLLSDLRFRIHGAFRRAGTIAVISRRAPSRPPARRCRTAA